MNKAVKVFYTLSLVGLTFWLVIFIISLTLNYKVTTHDIFDEIHVIVQDTTISKWIDIDKSFEIVKDDKRIKYRIGISFIPSENTALVKKLNELKAKAMKIDKK